MKLATPYTELKTLTTIPVTQAIEKRIKIKPVPKNRYEVLFITSYPPRECGIATYSQDLIKALSNKFNDSFSLKVCALEAGTNNYTYPKEVEYTLDTTDPKQFKIIAERINKNAQINTVLIQHEFGFFHQADASFLEFLFLINIPIIVVFHTVLPNPSEALLKNVRSIGAASASIIVMTRHSSEILQENYDIPRSKIEVIAHGTHLVPHLSKDYLKEKYNYPNRKVLSTFGLLSSGKGIETTLEAMPDIIDHHPNALFLIIGKTHPGVIAAEGETYRSFLQHNIDRLGLHDHVQFINRYLPLEDLLEYLQLTDIYLFTSKDRHQAVSGTFSYALSCACPIISTAIPHAKEVLRDDTGILIDFQDSIQLAAGVNRLMGNESLMASFSTNTLQRIVPSAWENSAIAHAKLLRTISESANHTEVYNVDTELSGVQNPTRILSYCLPEINLSHIKKMTTDFGMYQFSKINQPDPDSGYTLDDNARALIGLCMHYASTKNKEDLKAIRIYLNFILFCLQPTGHFLNYVDVHHQFTDQNKHTNLADSNGRAIWALGYVVSLHTILPIELISKARLALLEILPNVEKMHSTRAMAFAIKGLYFFNQAEQMPKIEMVIRSLANRLVQMYRHESDGQWQWYESYLTYANSILPEALLYAWLATGEKFYGDIAQSSFDFLLGKTFDKDGIQVISNKNWLHKGQEHGPPGQQPIDVAYTILALNAFYLAFKNEDYHQKMVTAFNWFLGANFLNQIIYNPCTGGCYDGLEATQINLNQGAESTVCYLMARLTIGS